MKIWLVSYTDITTGHTYDAVGHAKNPTRTRVYRAVQSSYRCRGLRVPFIRELAAGTEISELEIGRVYLDRGKAGEVAWKGRKKGDDDQPL